MLSVRPCDKYFSCQDSMRARIVWLTTEHMLCFATDFILFSICVSAWLVAHLITSALQAFAHVFLPLSFAISCKVTLRSWVLSISCTRWHWCCAQYSGTIPLFTHALDTALLCYVLCSWVQRSTHSDNTLLHSKSDNLHCWLESVRADTLNAWPWSFSRLWVADFSRSTLFISTHWNSHSACIENTFVKLFSIMLR